MSTFTLKQDGFKDYTSIPNCFIEKFMPKAAGEFVKIYIYILKCMEENRAELSISRIADVFNDTEKDIIRALKYWYRKGLITLSFDGDVLTSLKINHLPEDEDGEETKIVKGKKEEKEGLKCKEYTKEQIESFSNKEDIPMLLYSIQKYLGRTLTNSDMNRVLFFCEDLKFPDDLVEYLFEYCVSSGHDNIRYIEKTAIAWKEAGITTVNAAKKNSAMYSENCYPVLKEFGLTGRNPSKGEADYVSRWTLSYGFDMSLVLEAVRRTMQTIHQPSFEYADSILKRWKDAGIKDMDMVKEADKAFDEKKSSKPSSSSSKKKNGFNDFDQRNYDWDELEANLFNLK